MSTRRALPSRREAKFKCAFAILVLFASAALLAAATLAPAPPEVLPFVVLLGLGGPMVAAVELSLVIDALHRADGDGETGSMSELLDTQALEELIEHLAGLPETPHPLGL